MALQGGEYVTRNERQNEKVADRVGENSEDGEAQDTERDKSINEVVAGISKENGENQSSKAELDPVAESIFKLQFAGEAFQKEVRKLMEIGDETQEMTVEEVYEASSSRMLGLKEITEIPPYCLQKHVKTLKQDVDSSESKLEEAKVVLKAKKAGVANLECEKIEDLFTHKLEEELQYVTISKAIEKLKNDSVNQITFSDELETTLNVLRDAQSNVNMLKKQAEKLETCIEDTVETEEVEKLKKRVCLVTLYLFIQPILLVLVSLLFIFHLSPHDAGVIPT